ncbi:MAG: VTT domain-containing protein [Candidatus Methylomirabilales bacterium]
MEETLAFLSRYGEWIIFGVVFAEQIGAPFPATPFLLGAGALAGAGRLSLPAAVGLAVAASLLADMLWYGLGRLKGGPVLHFLCRITFEPDGCVRRTHTLFARHGLRSLLVAKFFPGLSTIAPPLAGMVRARAVPFALYSGAAALLWAGSWAAVGYLASDLVEPIAAHASRFGSLLLAGVFAAFLAYVGWRAWRRREAIRRLRTARVTPEEVRRALEAGEPLAVVDLRTRLDIQAAPYAIAGAIRIPAEEIEERHEAIPTDRDIVLYCS